MYYFETELLIFPANIADAVWIGFYGSFSELEKFGIHTTLPARPRSLTAPVNDLFEVAASSSAFQLVSVRRFLEREERNRNSTGATWRCPF